ncbi:MAG: Rap1a/Tai family immunity protein [Proteobacteria bacterium]|jgi:hypothetical protein|nr:Rap1a/Tai family immunity protein [Pseudomonadota bacterium]MDA1134923.1 Rap1a/Tai family immunity protein [Pseudomonadota bacterium]
MVKFFIALFSIIIFSTKSYSSSNNLFFTTAQFITYCKSENIYELGICDGYIISVSDMIYALDKKTAQICLDENISIKTLRGSIINFIVDNAGLMNVEANKVIGQFFVNTFQCKK